MSNPWLCENLARPARQVCLAVSKLWPSRVAATAPVVGLPCHVGAHTLQEDGVACYQKIRDYDASLSQLGVFPLASLEKTRTYPPTPPRDTQPTHPSLIEEICWFHGFFGASVGYVELASSTGVFREKAARAAHWMAARCLPTSEEGADRKSLTTS